jgi:quercetin dioxygenase-like cupin family protein
MCKKWILLLFSFLAYGIINAQEELPDPLAAGWNDEAVCILLEENDHLRVLRCTFESGVGHEKHFHAAHYAYAISGSRFRVEDEKGIREVDFPTGSNYYNNGVDWHQVLNIGDSTAVVLIIEPK